MKRLSIFLMAVIILAACKSSDKKIGPEKMSREDMIRDSIKNVENQKVMADTANYSSIQWLDSSFLKLGKVKEGDDVDVVYHFKNIGNRPLVITTVRPGCGCTVAEKPEAPIAPGAEGVIKAKFDSKGKKGNNRKYITVEANSKPVSTFTLEFEVDVE